MTFNSEIFDQDFYKEYMALIDSKPLIKSVSFWGLFLGYLPLLLEKAPDVLTQILPVLSPQAQTIVSVVGGLIALYGTTTRKKAISGVFSSPAR